MRISPITPKKEKPKFQVGGRSFQVTDQNANTDDQRMPQYGNNILASLAYKYLPSTEIGTDVNYYENDGRVPVMDIVKGLPSLLAQRRQALEGIAQGSFPDGSRLTDDLYAKYLGVDAPGQTLKNYSGELPDDLKKSKTKGYINAEKTTCAATDKTELTQNLQAL